ncbi:hypothetical protein VST7929_00766 [Vibrio stylophorae]|uniref:CENP-V/GFA domain-containing protein n=1 Tax=Vibrio stylophorae TaxID=659351 RepID=A0ABN8DU86_9VIBR|nr:GFA family protein [Vibrio stylophorae]CAH0532917.1 hypothetical protein VST7929_00766 [Vibrio stylophorae]
MSEPKQGQCLCGQVKITATPAQQNFSVCHCRMCRQWGGGPLFAIPCGQSVVVEGQENVQEFDSSPWAKRGFCRHCGTHLYYRVKKSNEFNVPLGLLENMDNTNMAMQYFIDLKPSNYCFNNQTEMLTSAQIEAYFAKVMAEAKAEAAAKRQSQID